MLLRALTPTPLSRSSFFFLAQHHANLTDAHSSLRTWKSILRADTDVQHEGASLPTFQAAFDKIVKSGVSPEDIRTRSPRRRSTSS